MVQLIVFKEFLVAAKQKKDVLSQPMKPLELIKKVFGSVIKSKLIQKDLAEVVYS